MNLKFDIKSLLKSKKAVDAEVFESTPSDGNKKWKAIAIWGKSNALVLILGVTSVSALIAATIISSDFFTANQNTAEEISKKWAEVAKLERTPVSIVIPGNEPTTGAVLVNRKLVDAVKTRMSHNVSSGTEILQSALKHNQGNHSKIMSLRLPAGDAKLQQIHLDMHDRLMERYADLLKKCRAVLPPAEEDILVELQRSKLRFVQAELSKSIEMKLTPDEQLKLVSDLTNRRLAAYREVAVNGGLYLDAQSIGAPSKHLDDPNLLQLWMMQWKFWIAEDIIEACTKVNEQGSIAASPVKRIVAIQFVGPVKGGAAPSAAAEASAETADASQSPEGGTSAVMGAPIDPNAPVSLANYANSFQGWGSNQLYDVYKTTVTLVVETAKIPAVTNSFAQQNFIAITNIRIVPLDPFAAIQSGYFYGENPVSSVTLTLESVWLRQWTGPLMPDEVRLKFGTTGQVHSALAPDANAPAVASPTQE